MGTPPQDHPDRPARCILGRDLARNPDQNPVGPCLPSHELAAARHARDDLLGAAALAPACNRRLLDGDAEIDVEAQPRVPRTEAIANQIAQSELSRGHCHLEGPDFDAPRRAFSWQAAGARPRAGTLACLAMAKWKVIRWER